MQLSATVQPKDALTIGAALGLYHLGQQVQLQREKSEEAENKRKQDEKTIREATAVIEPYGGFPTSTKVLQVQLAEAGKQRRGINLGQQIEVLVAWLTYAKASKYAGKPNPTLRLLTTKAKQRGLTTKEQEEVIQQLTERVTKCIKEEAKRGREQLEAHARKHVIVLRELTRMKEEHDAALAEAQRAKEEAETRVQELKEQGIVPADYSYGSEGE